MIHFYECMQLQLHLKMQISIVEIYCTLHVHKSVNEHFHHFVSAIKQLRTAYRVNEREREKIVNKLQKKEQFEIGRLPHPLYGTVCFTEISF